MLTYKYYLGIVSEFEFIIDSNTETCSAHWRHRVVDEVIAVIFALPNKFEDKRATLIVSQTHNNGYVDVPFDFEKVCSTIAFQRKNFIFKNLNLACKGNKAI